MREFSFGKKLIIVMLIALFSSFLLAGCGKGKPVAKVITVDKGEDKVTYSTIYDNEKIGESEKFEADKAKVLAIDGNYFEGSSENFNAYVIEPSKDGSSNYDLSKNDSSKDDASKPRVAADLNKTEQKIIGDIKDTMKHPIYRVQLFQLKNGGSDAYFAYVILNVNLHSPSTLYRFDRNEGSLKELCSWDSEEGVELLGIKLIES